MRIAITGGGTGGHIYPAIEVARELAGSDVEVQYYGSLRGQEGKTALSLGYPFFGFPSEPIYSLRTLKGWTALLEGIRCMAMARKRLKIERPDVVFSTGGYSAAPIVGAAWSLRIPYVIHEANSIPGRSNRLFASGAFALTCAFKKTQEIFPHAERTGQPIRAALRAVASQPRERENLVLVVGGSQGSAFLNEVAPQSSPLLQHEAAWLHATGPNNYKALAEGSRAPNYEMRPYLEANEMAEAYGRASVVVGRSGGSLAEFALFRVPSVLIPLPTSADNHQLHNAEEFVSMDAATLLPQSLVTADSLASAVDGWLADPARRQRAQAALGGWDQPDASEKIAGLVKKAAEKRR